jgi:hypothetical protein
MVEIRIMFWQEGVTSVLCVQAFIATIKVLREGPCINVGVGNNMRVAANTSSTIEGTGI